MAIALSARALLFLSFIGAFILGVLAVCFGHWQGFVALVIYGLSTVLPVTILELGKK